MRRVQTFRKNKHLLLCQMTHFGEDGFNPNSFGNAKKTPQVTTAPPRNGKMLSRKNGPPTMSMFNKAADEPVLPGGSGNMLSRNDTSFRLGAVRNRRGGRTAGASTFGDGLQRRPQLKSMSDMNAFIRSQSGGRAFLGENSCSGGVCHYNTGYSNSKIPANLQQFAVPFKPSKKGRPQIAQPKRRPATKTELIDQLNQADQSSVMAADQSRAQQEKAQDIISRMGVPMKRKTNPKPTLTVKKPPTVKSSIVKPPIVRLATETKDWQKIIDDVNSDTKVTKEADVKPKVEQEKQATTIVDKKPDDKSETVDNVGKQSKMEKPNPKKWQGLSEIVEALADGKKQPANQDL